MNKIKFLTQEKGSIFIMTALLFATLITFAALAIDVGIWYWEKRKLQVMADTGAIAAAKSYVSKGSATILAEATYDLNLNGCTAANQCTIVGINNPPLSGANTGNVDTIEVILSQPGTAYLSSLIKNQAPTIVARSVASILPNNNCITLLGTSGTTLNIKGGGPP